MLGFESLFKFAVPQGPRCGSVNQGPRYEISVTKVSIEGHYSNANRRLGDRILKERSSHEQ
jgi:hypothetical protein